MEKYFFIKKIELNSRYCANRLALLVITLVLCVFVTIGSSLNTVAVFIVVFSAVDLIFLLMCFYKHAHFIAISYFFLYLSALWAFNFDLMWIIDYSNFTFENLYNTSGPFPVTGYILYHTFCDLHYLGDLLFGYGFSNAYTYLVASYVINSFLFFSAYGYLLVLVVFQFTTISLVLFGPLFSSIVVGFFGGKLGGKYCGYLTTGTAGCGAFAALYLWLIHPMFLNYFHPSFTKFFKEREEYYGELYNNAINIENKISTNPDFALRWHDDWHPDAIGIAVSRFKEDYDLSTNVSNFIESYFPLDILRNRGDLEISIDYGNLFKFYSLEVNWLFKFDNLALTAAFTILFISSLVHLYSCDYMSKDPHTIRFFSFLSMFTFFMVMLVLSANMLMFYIAWEGVGLCSFLLISFWFTRAQAAKAAVKALLINKIGDVFLLVAAALAFNMCGSLDFSIIFSVAPIAGQKLFLPLFGLKEIDVLCLLLLLAAFVKSAQLFFHVWLADAMEGPTPVSALLHAATMVTAGVFLVIRFSFVFEYSSIALTLMLYVGLLTTIVSGLIGLFQYDIKKIIAYSTCSQLGLMFVACGLSGYTLALFHFFNHAFFKALLFLAAGVLIHALKNEQDIRKMGGLKNLFPLTYTVFIIGSLSLVGFPFFSGYYSKDAIIALAYARFAFTGEHLILFYIILFSVFLTCLYSFKLVFYVFLGEKTNISKHLHNSQVKENLNIFITLPLVVLSVLSIISGAFFKDYFIGLGSNFYFEASIYSMSEELKYFMFFKEQKILTFFVLLFSYTFCTICAYYYNSGAVEKFLDHKKKAVRSFFIFFNRKGFFDDIYNLFINSKVFRFAYSVFLKMDKGLLEIFGPTGIYMVLRKISFKIKADFNKGPLPVLIKFMLFGVLVILVIAFFF